MHTGTLSTGVTLTLEEYPDLSGLLLISLDLRALICSCSVAEFFTLLVALSRFRTMTLPDALLIKFALATGLSTFRTGTPSALSLPPALLAGVALAAPLLREVFDASPRLDSDPALCPAAPPALLLPASAVIPEARGGLTAPLLSLKSKGGREDEEEVVEDAEDDALVPIDESGGHAGAPMG
ncbi:hypothetical protein Mapa_005989 [Marchantia paleacea]|nr:hypothetical protein Mapa_005989 [Marchantia paleacea]